MSTRIINYDPGDPSHAMRMAEMFNDFNSAWPGGFTRGVPETGARVQDRMARRDRLAVLLAEHDGDFVGYCDLVAWPDHPDLSYVDLLGVRRAHHGSGAGRLLLRAALERAIEAGCREVTLHTWAGNTKAVPLYKKCGFQWEPDSDVFMRCFIPAILRSPVGRDFFAGRDWYACQERDLTVAPDDLRWNGMRAYRYRFRDGVDALEVIVDAASGEIAAVETPEFAAACWVPVEEAHAGRLFPVRWQVRALEGASGGARMRVVCDEGLDGALDERLEGGGECTLLRDFRVAADAFPRREGERPRCVRSTVSLGGLELPLAVGVTVQWPVEVHHAGCGLFPRRPERVEVRLRNRLDEPVSGTLSLAPTPGLRCEPAEARFEAEAGSWTMCHFDVTAEGAGEWRSAWRVYADGVALERVCAFRAWDGPRAIASLDPEGETVVLESPSLAVGATLRGGSIWVDRAPGGRTALWQEFAAAGPPFQGWSLRPARLEERIDRAADGDRVTLRTSPASRPGIVVEREVSVVAGDLIRVAYRVRNETDRAEAVQLCMATRPELRGAIAALIDGAIVHEPIHPHGGLSSSEGDLCECGESLSEGWIAAEHAGEVCGLVWGGACRLEREWSLFPALVLDVGEVPAHGSAEAPVYHIVCGAGDWRTVRGWWRRLQHPSSVREERAPEAVRAVDLRADPCPAVLVSETTAVRLALHHRRGAAASGSIRLHGRGLAVEPYLQRFEGLRRGAPFAGEAWVKRPPAAGVYAIEAEVDIGVLAMAFRVPAIHFGDGAAVLVTREADGLFCVDSGRLRFRVAPSFLGSIVSAHCHGADHLMSAHPEERPFAWSSPWFGGVHPCMESMGHGKLAAERFEGEATERTGERGLVWSGVRVWCDLAHRERRWMRIETEYLTLPGAEVIAVVSRWANRTTARMASPDDVGVAAWMSVGGDHAQGVVHTSREGVRERRRRGPFSAELQSGRWAAIENPETGHAVAIATGDPLMRITVDDLASDGAHFSVLGRVEIAPASHVESLAWLAFGPDLAQAEAYGALADLERLP
ncbi:MAG TPA: GNAT family N-acetyltransferase [Chthonomonadales bacterium]|nr:GNAT family N-acetyltransferase [Chthonomonadales bacterium]